jgi:multidrug resistance efflux pump
LASTQAVVAQKTLAFNRAKSLLQSQAVPRAAFDDVQKELLSAQASLEFVPRQRSGLC